MAPLQNLILVLVLSASMSFSALAQETSTPSPSTEGALFDGSQNFIEIYGFWGHTSAKVNRDSAEDPTLNEYGLGYTLGLPVFSLFMLGLGGEYRYLGQTSDVDQDLGNMGGQRWTPVFLSLGIPISTFFFKIDYFFTGEYRLDKPTYDQSHIVYGDPHGYRFSAYLYQIYGFALGLNYESIQFKSRLKLNSGVTQLSQPIKTQQIGAFASYLF